MAVILYYVASVVYIQVIMVGFTTNCVIIQICEKCLACDLNCYFDLNVFSSTFHGNWFKIVLFVNECEKGVTHFSN